MIICKLVAYLVWFTKAVWSMGIMLSGQGAVWLGGACCWEKWWPAIAISISGWADMGKNKQKKKPLSIVSCAILVIMKTNIWQPR